MTFVNALQASPVGYRVRDLLVNRPSGTLYSVHAKAVYCSIPMRPLLLIHCTELGRYPLESAPIADLIDALLLSPGYERSCMS